MTDKTNEEADFDFWCVVELFGHQRMAGRLTEKPKGSTVFFQIDVPDKNGMVRYSRIINASSIYAINPTTREAVLRICNKPGYDTNRPAVPYVPVPDHPKDPIPERGAFIRAVPDEDEREDYEDHH